MSDNPTDPLPILSTLGAMGAMSPKGTTSTRAGIGAVGSLKRRRMLPPPIVCTPNAWAELPNDATHSQQHGYASDLGRRSRQEDAVRALPEAGLFAVMDGHGGAALAHFLAARILDSFPSPQSSASLQTMASLSESMNENITMTSPRFPPSLKNLHPSASSASSVSSPVSHSPRTQHKSVSLTVSNPPPPTPPPTPPTPAVHSHGILCPNMSVESSSDSIPTPSQIHGMFDTLQREWMSHPLAHDLAACAATIVAIRNQTLCVAHVGDVRAVLATKSRPSTPTLASISLRSPKKWIASEERFIYATPLTRDHNVNDAYEVERVCKSGGAVWDGRVDGMIKVTRTFGALASYHEYLQPVPDVSLIPITREMAFVIVATDGVWNHISNEEAVDIAASGPTPKDASEGIVLRAKKAGSRDNITALVIDLGYFASE